MKKFFSSLPFRLLVALAIGILLGQVFGEVAMKVVVSVQFILGQLGCVRLLCLLCYSGVRCIFFVHAGAGGENSEGHGTF